ncbi:MAG: hypothetical protein A3E31_15790 [Candidatus Rokubacteria bacterium RIFCSPHIGHO2_12_FULL_73_22]|nr:MAG: hypothetical protein A3D33_14590 [Candidatus Rokubacteria bacterium RIFCSPHIGHO2_02_FULL_73_26]OGK98864.1 MAG: hypothetical protein A3E31_15790 [Candidatus Rokubacteria bacterium RIFCSPHIGHO2_12_FULL_73_22]OGL09855.1 MAG: hypothetical protein A3I14_19695 [Candidatus Rokubacteria bacterium RIFCSPLOWO2_02_FULL_73_56]OGL26774.1 MAG: hypothetical protein A3G44_09020 [Candidatus Rokubacteria bacterium RIFCSPLOWO2_12_FULL_73_47]
MRNDEFIARVKSAAALASPEDAERMARTVLEALADLLPDSESRRQFATQLPGVLKAHIAGRTPRSLPMDRDAFLQHVGAGLGARVPEAERAVLAVWSVVHEAMAAGEIADFEARAPKDVAALLRRAGVRR